MHLHEPKPNTSTAAVESALAEWIRSSEFSCLGAKAAERRGLVTEARVGALGDHRTVPELHRELEKFTTETLTESENFNTFVAVFDGPDGLTEERFEAAFWAQLSALHEFDRSRYSWARGVSSDPDSATFAFSVAGHPYFIVGLHPGSSRISRRFSKPAIAFNSHEQFDRLKENGVYEGLQRRIRQREVRLQGSINPNLAEFGEQSEVRQYSGRAVEEDWKCPFEHGSLGSDR
ncbi:YqcI/YcgG family protein [Actinomadura soli]|uniref:YqcI/YcgG family protein n=1 Tax=Actinomadura soli TaxID=2508997 RepID=A0A5C4JCL8_9ACTN|nr:guanitoxin biosynthesis heme-dependent pre-guanitoxin N-hydroxylase GntA [Actinomadura soli]TMR01105.1 YqcI/YcgG family protein [Actinomadura soli]